MILKTLSCAAENPEQARQWMKDVMAGKSNVSTPGDTPQEKKDNAILAKFSMTTYSEYLCPSEMDSTILEV